MLISPYATIIIFSEFGRRDQTYLFTQIVPVLGGVDAGF
jgi:hypothetical protein